MNTQEVILALGTYSEVSGVELYDVQHLIPNGSENLCKQEVTPRTKRWLRTTSTDD